MRKKILNLMILMQLPVMSWAWMAQPTTDADAFLHEVYQVAEASGLRERGIGERLKWFAEAFNNKNHPFLYVADPLGEGEDGHFDQDPLYRFDVFDCTTFVETALALAYSDSPDEFRRTIDHIRYKDGQVAYENRNHFTSLDWIPNNLRKGYVKDISFDIALSQTRWSETLIEKDQWYVFKGVDFLPLSHNESKIWATLPYVAKEDLLRDPEMLRRIPSGVLFNVVRPDWPLKKAIGTNLDISHQGVLVWEDDVLYMIHASNGASRDGRDNQKRVKKEVLVDYIRDVMMPSPTMAGLNILSGFNAGGLR